MSTSPASKPDKLDLRRRSRSPLARIAPAVFIIGLPTLLAALYAFLIAVPMYQADSQFILRGPATKSVGAGRLFKAASEAVGIGAILDGFAIRSYLLSKAALHELDSRINYTGLMQGRGDIFNYLKKNATFEEKYAFYIKNVKIQFNIAEGIITMNTYAFSPQDAYTINKTLLRMAEEFANNMNARARRDSLRFAREEVREAQKLLEQAQRRLKEWQIRSGDINPEIRTKMIGEIISELEKMKVKYYLQLIELISYNKESTLQSDIIKKRISAINRQIKNQEARLVRKDGKSSLAASLLEYERLKLAKELAEKNFENAQKALQAAQLSVTRKQKYVVPISKPTVPQEASYPKPYYIIIAAFIISLVFYAIWGVIMSTVRSGFF